MKPSFLRILVGAEPCVERPVRVRLPRRRGRLHFEVNAEWEKTDEARETVRNSCHLMHVGTELEDCFPQDHGKDLPAAGAWIMVLNPPERLPITVPPFSIWFAKPWPMTRGGHTDKFGHIVYPKRVRVVTPKGDLGLMPSEYSVVKDISTFVAREREHCHVRDLSGRPAVDSDQLLYIMSRGIRRREALIMLLATIRDQSFVWFELSVRYAYAFGKEWPDPTRCPFCTPASEWPPLDLAASPFSQALTAT